MKAVNKQHNTNGNLQFQELQMVKDLPRQCGQQGVLGQVSREENESETKGKTDVKLT